MKSIFVNKAGEWKIGEFGYIFQIPPSQMNTFGFPLKRFSHLISNKYKSPEVLINDWETVGKYPGAIDSWGVACLLYEIFEGNFERIEELNHVQKMPKTLSRNYLRLITKKPNQRMKIDRLLKSKYFTTSEMVDTLLFLDSIQLKDSNQIDEFMEKLAEKLQKFPKIICKYKIFNQLVNSLKYGTGGANSIISIMKIGKMMDENEMKEHFIPSKF